MDDEAAAYDPVEVEERWRARWRADRLLEVDVERIGPDTKLYNLVEFPYPSAEGLHVGHAYTYTGADTWGRWQRMQGRAVFQPIGFDSFGIHTENYALKVGEHPRTLTAKTIAHYREQLERLGAAWAWDHELATSDPAYYRWTQWVFLRLHRAGLAVRREAPVVWCPSCLTVLAHEQLEGDRCERCSSRVTTRVTRQWFLRITAYADELVDGLDELDWPELAKRLQREWIGRSEGVEVDFPVPRLAGKLAAFTTRVDTLYGVTFLVVPPEHPQVEALAAGTPQEEAVRAFVEEARERAALPPERATGPRSSSRRGVFSGTAARHPASGAEVPVWVSDYVVAGYGTGAVMGVPAHDERDWEFAAAMGLPAVPVVAGPEGRAGAGSGSGSGSGDGHGHGSGHGSGPEGGGGSGPYTGEGVLVDSGPFSGMASGPARAAIAGWLEERGLGRRATRYRLHDWLISRQRYWGPPIPVVYCGACGTVPVPEDELPVLLPDVQEFRPTGTGESPLAAVRSFVETTCPACSGPARRETDVSDTFLDSAWYFLRYPSSDIHDRAWSEERTSRLLPVDMYAGGQEHVMRHHLYARFVTRALHDLGLVPFAEPFPRLRLHGLLRKDGAKMSKSRGNVVDPDAYVRRVGADNLRMYLQFCGPWEEGGDFSDEGMAGIERFSARVWRLVVDPWTPGPGGVDLRPLDRAVAAVGSDLERLKFNTALAALMELVRWARRQRAAMSGPEWNRTTRTVVLLLAPFAPHLAEELWSRIGGAYSVHQQAWPAYDQAALAEEEITLVVQVNGRRRDAVPAPAGTTRERALQLALASEKVRRHLEGRPLRDAVFVPDRLVNLVV